LLIYSFLLLLTGLFMRRAEGAGHHQIGHLLLAHPRHQFLVHQSSLRHGNRQGRMDGKTNISYSTIF